ncbi:MAG: hypothetical protein O3B01_30725 [Planctomycetota bacterium]|nr:hypothetical protein [Planctomycetota bacterium]MDA1142958.1 hypothetical protein [Planctomycetota bacterium]
MTRLEKIESLLISGCSIGIGVFAFLLPQEMKVGSFVLALSVLLLVQSLIRDLYLLLRIKRDRSAAEAKSARCICLESVTGVTGVFIGLMLVGGGSGPEIQTGALVWSVASFAVMTSGFLIKDMILEMGPWRIRREQDHLNLIFAWRPKPPF